MEMSEAKPFEERPSQMAHEAFAKEWRNYDDFGGSDGLDNATPPSRRQVAPQEYLEQRA